MPSPMLFLLLALNVLAFRLGPDAELKAELHRRAAESQIQAGCVVTCVGSLKDAEIRFADRPEATRLEGPFEIVSLTGTLSPDGDHLHISLGDRDGHTVSGHFVSGHVYTTAEVVVGVLPYRFSRKLDPRTGYPELVPESLK